MLFLFDEADPMAGKQRPEPHFGLGFELQEKSELVPLDRIRCQLNPRFARPSPRTSAAYSSPIPVEYSCLSQSCASRARRFPHLALQVFCEVGDRRVIEQLGQIDEARIIAVDILVDLDELERARADLEQVVVDLDALARQRRLADRLQPAFQIRAGDVRPVCGPRSFERRRGPRRIRRRGRLAPTGVAALCRSWSSGCASPGSRDSPRCRCAR